jgi:hypothetical protein
MPGIPAEHAQDVREALRLIVSDPGHGSAALSNSQMMSNLLKDLLPDSPREKNLLVAAADADLAGMMSDHVRQGIDGPSAVRLAAATFGASTHFTDSACTWVATELAVALGLSTDPADAGTTLPEGEITTAEQPDDGLAAATRVASAPVVGTAPTDADAVATIGKAAPAPATAVRRTVSVSAFLVFAGSLALLGGCIIPVFYSPGPEKIWGNSASNSWLVSAGPTMVLLVGLLCGVLLSSGRSSRMRQAAGGAALAAGAQALVLYWAIYWQLVKDYGNQLGSGVLLGVLGAILLIAGGVLELVRQARASREIIQS